jgi:hypothetical protein
LAVIIGVASSVSANSLDAEFDAALGMLGLTPRTARFDPDLLRLFTQSEFASVTFQTMHADVWRAPFYADRWRKQFSAAAGKPSELAALGGRMLGLGVRRTLLGDPIAAAAEFAKKPGALEVVIESLRRRGTVQGVAPDLRPVPPKVREAAALVLQVVLDIVPYRRAAFAKVSNLTRAYQSLVAAEPEVVAADQTLLGLDVMRAVDLKFLLAGASDFLLAAEAASTMLADHPPFRPFRWEIETAWGRVVLSGGTDDRYEGPHLLVIDLGGNDTYLNLPATPSANQWASVVIDAAGNDRYLSDQRLADIPVEKFEPRKTQSGPLGPASALFGYACLFDLDGDDLYRTHRPGIASATYGVAALQDLRGNDRYDGYANALGFGQFGIGVLEDLAGDDLYDGFTQVQGHGQTSGFGLLMDRQGDDRYRANDQVIDFPSPQSREHNVSMAQGAGNGRRADYLDGHSLSGGIGILYDQGGNDQYACGVFGQGVGYWEGIGFLWDDAGNDQYEGQWYVMGASAHFAIGFLEDQAGDDRYTALMNMALGAGHDFGYGMFIDRAGSDRYSAPNLSLGAGNANGIGIFVDLFGDDQYQSLGVTLGRGAEAPKGSLRERGLTLGLFLDLAGTDQYPESATWAKNGERAANWTDRGPTPAESQAGVFWDRAAP